MHCSPSGGFNPLTFFEPIRQQDKALTEWYWADILHYLVVLGQFAANLVSAAKETENPNLIAYAYGYLTHYATDVVGHPYVNQITGGPWRSLWQRHHLVENFIDAYVWDRWHQSSSAVSGAADSAARHPGLYPEPGGERRASYLREAQRSHQHRRLGPSRPRG